MSTLFALFIVAITNCELIPFILENYHDDAEQLYFDEILNNKSHFNYNNPILDEAEVNKILYIIQSVYELKHTARDAVFDVFQIHGSYGYSFNSLVLKVNPQLPSIQNLAKGSIPTGDEDLDKILTSYEFDSVETFYGYPNFPYLTVSTKKRFNLLPIAAEFNKLESVVSVEVNSGAVIGGGDNIKLIRDNIKATITFSVGWGDCPAGCIFKHYWIFEVENGSAQFVKEEGDPLAEDISEGKISGKEKEEEGSKSKSSKVSVVVAVVLSIVGIILLL